jgi:hypothetical protein
MLEELFGHWRGCPKAIHHMQKALFEMNVQLSNVISDITGESGLRIIEAILAGERDPEQLASLCSTRIKASRQMVAKSLHGSWEQALLFCLKTALDTYRFSQANFANSIAPSLRGRSYQNPGH